ncbi:MAG: glycosyl hydrolase family 32, partial [Vicinamibacterales bacterium]
MISRRSFLRGAAVGAFSLPFQSVVSGPAPEVLYNGITLGTPWPPLRRYADEYPVAVPYLVSPPAVIPIDVGRQLLVDDFLVEETSMMRQWHHATYYPANPILRPETTWEHRDDVNQPNNRPSNPSSMVFSDGVFFDPSDRLFKMWYMGGYGATTCLATSEDGIAWTRPSFDVLPGTNVVNRTTRDSSTVWLDQFERDRGRRFKKALFYNDTLNLFTSPDGVHWHAAGMTGFAYDRSTFFYNPFRKVWVFSLRGTDYPGGGVNSRYRLYWESPEFAANHSWT